MGIFNRVKDGAVSSGKKIVGYEHARGGWMLIRDWASKWNPNAMRQGKVETFQAAYDRLGLDEEVLAKVYRNHILRFYISAGLMVVGFLSVIYSVLNQNFIVLVPLIGFVCICLSQMFSASFRVYQIKIRQLAPVSQWVANRGEWIPTKFDMPKPKVRSKSTSVSRRSSSTEGGSRGSPKK